MQYISFIGAQGIYGFYLFPFLSLIITGYTIINLVLIGKLY